MEKKFTLSVAFLALLLSFNVRAQVYQQGNFLFDAYYGFPNLYTSVVKTKYNNSPNFNNGFSIGSLGPLGVKGEYLVTNKIGIGLQANYATTFVNATIVDGGNNYNYKASTNVFRIFPTINFHIGNSARFDPYFSFGMGYRTREFNQKTNDPNGSDITLKSLVPVATRFELGFRYFFTNHIGATAFIGFPGGALVGAGICTKF